MEPATWMMVSAGMQAVGAVISAGSQAAQLERQAQASEYNAAVNRQQAQHARQVSTAQQLDQNRKARQILGTQRAAAAQSGVGMGGSTADVLEQSETLAELDQLNLAYEGTIKARGYSTQADLDEYQARSYRSQVTPTLIGGAFSAGSALAKGAFALSGGLKTTTPSSFLGSGLRPGSGMGFRSYGSTGLRLG